MQSNPDLTNFLILKERLERHYNRVVDIRVHAGNPHRIKRYEAFNNLVKKYDGEICFYIDERCKWTLYNIRNVKYIEGTNVIYEPSRNEIAKNPELKYLVHPFDAVTYPAEYYFPIE